MSIKAFGKSVSRNKTYKIIINDKIGDICHANNTESLDNLLMFGWKSLEEWTNNELEEFINELLIENQPNEKI